MNKLILILLSVIGVLILGLTVAVSNLMFKVGATQKATDVNSANTAQVNNNLNQVINFINQQIQAAQAVKK